MTPDSKEVRHSKTSSGSDQSIGSIARTPYPKCLEPGSFSSMAIFDLIVRSLSLFDAHLQTVKTLHNARPSVPGTRFPEEEAAVTS